MNYTYTGSHIDSHVGSQSQPHSKPNRQPHRQPHAVTQEAIIYYRHDIGMPESIEVGRMWAVVGHIIYSGVCYVTLSTFELCPFSSTRTI
jgi:hypothetical protein